MGCETDFTYLGMWANLCKSYDCDLRLQKFNFYSFFPVTVEGKAQESIHIVGFSLSLSPAILHILA